MKNINKQHYIISLLIIIFVAILGIFYFLQMQNKKLERISYEIDLKTSDSYKKQRAEIDSILYGNKSKF